MIKDITIVSLSRGTIGEPFVKHELDIGIKRLEDYGLNVRFSKYALSGIDFIQEHPELRAKDLLDAFLSDTDMILCAIGGEDTYRLLPYLFKNDELKNVVNNKIFLGYSDSTINHFMLHKVGLNTFYGQSFLSDICEIDKEMLPYTKHYFEELINTKTISKIKPSDIWYRSRTDYSKEAIGTSLDKYQNNGFELIQGKSVFKGKIFGGCIDTIYDIFNNERFSDTVSLCKEYDLFPSINDWEGKILLLETSEEKASPEKYREAIRELKKTGLFNVINGILIGKPVDEIYYEEYKQILLEEINNKDLSIVSNINIGHALPRCIIPFGVDCVVDIDKQEIVFNI